jgi:hypothetical protein
MSRQKFASPKSDDPTPAQAVEMIEKCKSALRTYPEGSNQIPKIRDQIKYNEKFLHE